MSAFRRRADRGLRLIAEAHPDYQTSNMEQAPLASRLAQRLKWPIALIGGGSAAMAGANVLNWVPDRLADYTAATVATAAACMFVCAVFDMRFQRAVSALNADLRAETRRKGWVSRITGAGLPMVNRVLLAVSILLLAVIAVAAGGHPSAAELGFAGFFLVCCTQIALMVRGQPTDRWVSFFS
jgi:hypothetical protein